MIQEVYQKAMLYAGEQHKDQNVPGTEANYLLHLSNVAMEVLIAFNAAEDFDLECAIQLAILHDVIEDTNSTFQDINDLFGKEIAEGVLALTKDKSILTKEEQLLDSLNRIKVQRVEVGLVKLADRITNLQRPPKHWSKNKIQQYARDAKLISEALQESNQYLSERILHKIEEYEKYIETT